MKEILPREKAFLYGINSLANYELLALIIRTGSKDKNVIELSKEIIDSANGIENLFSYTLDEFLSINGLGKAKSLEILAIIELSKRLSTIKKIEKEKYLHPDKIANWIRLNLAFSNQESFFAVYMNRSGWIIKSEKIFIGTCSQTNVSIEEILRRVILSKSSCLIIAHNHPGGNCQPSKADIDLTNKLKDAFSVMDIILLDHIIVTRNDYYSFKEKGIL